jgi:hypothetical protein
MKVIDPDFERRVRDSFARQGAMHHLGAVMTTVEPGRVVYADATPAPEMNCLTPFST